LRKKLCYKCVEKLDIHTNCTFTDGFKRTA